MILIFSGGVKNLVNPSSKTEIIISLSLGLFLVTPDVLLFVLKPILKDWTCSTKNISPAITSFTNAITFTR